MSDPKILLIGATGLVGQAVVARTSRALTILARRTVDGDTAAHHNVVVAPATEWPAIIAAEKPDILISCLGTTIKQAGSEAAFRAVDHDMLLAVATAAKAAGTRQMICISSVGASPHSRNFYLATKGQVETALRALEFTRLDLLRPGLLMGDRQGPPRIGESLAMLAAPLSNALLHGGFRRYRSINAATVAAAILALAAKRGAGGGAGVHIHENDAMHRLAD